MDCWCLEGVGFGALVWRLMGSSHVEYHICISSTLVNQHIQHIPTNNFTNTTPRQHPVLCSYWPRIKTAVCQPAHISIYLCADRKIGVLLHTRRLWRKLTKEINDRPAVRNEENESWDVVTIIEGGMTRSNKNKNNKDARFNRDNPLSYPKPPLSQSPKSSLRILRAVTGWASNDSDDSLVPRNGKDN